MSIRAMSHIWQHSKQAQGNLLVLLAIADYADERGRAFPAVATLARKSRLSGRQVQRAIKELIASGELRKQDNAGPGGANLYFVALPKESPGLGDAPDKMSPRQNVRGDTHVTGGVTSTSPRGVTPMSPKPSLESSLNLHAEKAGANGASPKSYLSKSEVWTRCCAVLLHPADKPRSYQLERALADAAEMTNAEMTQIEQLHEFARAHPEKQIRLRQKMEHLLTDLPGELAKAAQHLNGHPHSTKPKRSV